MFQPKPVSTLTDLLIGISRMAFKGKIKIQDISNQLRFSLVHAAHEIYPNMNISELRELTGIPRATIKEHLNGDAPKFKQDNLATLLNELWELKDENQLIPRRGKHSFNATSYRIINSSFSPDIALNSLIKMDAVELYEDHVKILTNQLTVSNDILLAFKEISKTALLLIESGLHNANQKTPNERLYQRTIASTQIPHSSLKELHSQIMTYLDAAKIELKSIIDSYEVNVKPDSYEAYGVSLFEFSGYLNTAKCNK